MSLFRADLHCHSTCSDGTLTPEQLIYHALEKGLSALSITDHDTIAAYNDKIIEKAKNAGLDLITGVEFSTTLSGESIHLLGYGFALDSKEIHAFCVKHTERRTRRYQEILKRLASFKMVISEEELMAAATHSNNGNAHTTIGRPHIAMMMVQKGYVKTIPEAFKLYLGDGRPCYVQGEHSTPEETIDVIHSAGGVAIIAHPHLIKSNIVLKQLLKMDFDGIECYYSRFPKEAHVRFLQIAQSRNWLITGGSDFHGDVKPQIPLGSSWIDQQRFNELKARDHKISTKKTIQS